MPLGPRSDDNDSGNGNDRGDDESNYESKMKNKRSLSAIQSTVSDTLNGEVSIKKWRNLNNRVEKLEILHTTSLENFEEMLQNLLSKVKYATMADEWNVRRVNKPMAQAWFPVGRQKLSPLRPSKNSSRPASPSCN